MNNILGPYPGVSKLLPLTALAGGILVVALCQSPPIPDAPVVPPEPAPTASATVAPVPTPPKSATPPKPPEPPVSAFLYKFETKFKAGPKYEGRMTNITKLARKLNGIRIKPGEEFSFNKIAGPRTKKAGYKDAPTYFLGEVMPGVGGGSCQVSSTMYAAALHVNVEVTDRRPHSRASSYIPAGLDATVNYPEQCWDAKKPDKRICYDLKFKNPYDFDLVFYFNISLGIEKAKPKDKNGKKTLTVSVFGGPEDGVIPEVTTRWAAYGAPPFKVRYRRVSWWKDNRKKLKQSGRPGLRGARLLTIKWPDGKVTKRSVHSKYRPVSEVWHVGLAFEKPEEKTPSDEAP